MHGEKSIERARGIVDLFQEVLKTGLSQLYFGTLGLAYYRYS